MKIGIFFATLFLSLKICVADEVHSAIEELIGLKENDGNLILEMRKLIGEMSSAIEIAKL